MADPMVEFMRSLAEEWSARLGQILESMTDQRPRVDWHMDIDPPMGESMFWWAQALNIAPEPVIWVGAPEPTCLDLGTRTLRAAGVETVEPADARNTYLEILNQSLSGVAQTLSARFHRDINCEKGAEHTDAPAGVQWIVVEVVYPDGALPALLVGINAALIEQLERPPQDAESALETAGEAHGEAQALQRRGLAAVEGSRTLDLLMDVELPVSISFGRAELPLKDVLKLTTGSIVELNRGIAEPVELIVNNCVVARGEVVVMDGNYGVRIHEIISPQERLRTLK
jgi:flagellar motor switch protein FliN/FliY